jgi:hypothetical protein
VLSALQQVLHAMHPGAEAHITSSLNHMKEPEQQSQTAT